MKSQTYRLPGLVFTDHWFDLPLDYAKPNGEKIRVYGREVVSPDNEQRADLPWLVFFQGGPGFQSPRPDSKSGWLKRALREYRVLLLDQRGTGLSTPVTFQTMARFDTPKEQAAYLKHFRSDAIVRDAEEIRKELAGAKIRWSGLGQSYGGFILTRYLSAAPEGLREVFITGGLPPIDRPVDDIYRATYRRVLDKNKKYYTRYPQDVARVREIVDYVSSRDVRLPSGGKLTARRLQQLGIEFGMSDGFEHIHYLLEYAFVEGKTGKELNYVFQRWFENAQSYETNPIYVLLHEPIYCQNEASNWSADRVLKEFPQFDPSTSERVLFTGEMIYSWMLDDYEYLRPLKEAADILAKDDSWPRLYDLDKLATNTVPVAAAVYYEDMYVETVFSEETAGHIPSVRTWVTNEYEHNGIRSDGERVLDKLLGMLHGEA